MNHLHKSWGTLACKSRSNEDFWEHEWSKHGACSGLTQRHYFQASLELYSKYDIAGALRDAGILPDDRHYPVANITHALTARLGYPPQIACNKDPDGNQQLHEVRICVATDATTLIQCPLPPRTLCGASAQFPVYSGASSRHTVSTTDFTEF
jgi:ribonuclease T2